MKKFFIFITFLALLSGCSTPGSTVDYNVKLESGGKIYKVKKVVLSSAGNYMYVMYPENDTLNILPEQSTFSEGKTTTTVVKLN